MAGSKEIITGYIPVINEGYMRFFERHPTAEIGVFDESILTQFDYLRKDIRALSPETAAFLLRGAGKRTRLIGDRALSTLMHTPGTFMPDDDVSRELVSRFPESSAVLEPVFLRWDRESAKVNVEVEADRVEVFESNDPIVRALFDEAEKSTNWWRRVGAVLFDDSGIVHTAHNSSTPTGYSSAIDGDPRITAKRGEAIDTSIDIHAESRLIAQLARNGVSTEGKKIAVSTFPCPNCAKLIAECGIKACYFMEGYAMLDGEDVLRSADVELVKVIAEPSESNPLEARPYPTS